MIRKLTSVYTEVIMKPIRKSPSVSLLLPRKKLNNTQRNGPIWAKIRPKTQMGAVSGVIKTGPTKIQNTNTIENCQATVTF